VAPLGSEEIKPPFFLNLFLKKFISQNYFSLNTSLSFCVAVEFKQTKKPLSVLLRFKK